MMNDRKHLAVKVVAVLAIAAVFLIGALFFTKLMPPINRTQADAGPQPLPAVSPVAAAMDVQRKSIAEAEEPDMSGQDSAVLGVSTETGEAAICQHLEPKSSPQQKQICKKLSDYNRGKDKLTVPLIDKQVNVGATVGSKAKVLSQKLEKLINAID